MSDPIANFVNCRRALIVGLPRKPEWSHMRDKLSFLKYGVVHVKATQEEHYVVYAHAHPPMRRSGWMKLFPDATGIWKVTEFEDCKLYRELVRLGELKTLGEPLRKDLMQVKHETNAANQQTKHNAEYSGKNVTGKKRKAGNDGADFPVENKERKEEISKLKEDISKHKSFLGILEWQTENVTYRPKTQEAMQKHLHEIHLVKVSLDALERELASRCLSKTTPLY